MPYSELRAIQLKILDGVRLDRDDAIVLQRTDNLAGLFHLADVVRRRRHGQVARWVRNLQVNPTNICVLSCAFCDFAAKPRSSRAYVEQADAVASESPDDIREVHITGGLHPTWQLDDYLSYVSAFRRYRPLAGVKALTAVEVAYIAKRQRTSTEYIIDRMRSAGVSVMPGGGAEIFSERVRSRLFPHKIGADDWLRIHQEAHSSGIRSNATMLHGHIETPEERADHLLRVRDLQDRTGGFLAFIPLTYQPGETRLVPRMAAPVERLRQVAAARLVLDNVASITAYWVMLGIDVACMALHAGADDLGGTIVRERIAHAARAPSPAGLDRDDVCKMIRTADLTPVERDHLYRPITPVSAVDLRDGVGR